jgi:hypothetical protein
VPGDSTLSVPSSCSAAVHLHCRSVADCRTGDNGKERSAASSLALQFCRAPLDRWMQHSCIILHLHCRSVYTTDKWRQHSCIIFHLHCRSVLHHQRRAILGSKKSRPPEKSREIADYMFYIFYNQWCIGIFMYWYDHMPQIFPFIIVLCFWSFFRCFDNYHCRICAKTID